MVNKHLRMVGLSIAILIAFFNFGEFVFAEPLKVGTIERKPMSFRSESGEWKGFSIDLLEEISKKVDFDYELTEFDKFGDMISATEKGSVDLSISNITISAKREKTMDYSQPIIDSGLQLVISKDRDSKNIFKIILESGVLWFIAGAFGLLIIIAHLVWFFERGTSSDRHDYFRDDYIGGVWDAFWWAFIIMTMGGFENEVPASKFSRFLAMGWIITSLFFISMLTAQITSSMTVSGLTSDISSYKDLDNKRVGVMKSDPMIAFIKKEIGVNPSVFEKYDEMYKALKDNKVDAIIGDAPIINYYVAHTGKEDFRAVGELFKPEKYGIIYPEDSKLKDKIDQTLLEMQENGEYQEVYDKYFQVK
jgi:polar amino acid transport system substrate-binding protein